MEEGIKLKLLKMINKIPAGTFLVPMLISAVLYTFWPDLFLIGGLTETFFGGGSVNFIIGAITFFSGVGINIKTLRELFQRHGVILIVKFVLAVGLSLGFMALFGQEGIFGISALSFTIALSSSNPAAYIAVVSEMGEEVDEAAFGLVSLFAIPAVPMFIYGIVGTGGFDWMPVISTLIPLIAGIALGNIDSDFQDLFGPGMTVLIPILGWNLGQGVNLFDVLSSGLGGIILVIIFYVIMSLLVVTDKFALKNDGVAPMAMNAVAASSSAYPALVASSNPSVAPYVSSAAGQILTLAILTIILTPILTRKLFGNNSE